MRLNISSSDESRASINERKLEAYDGAVTRRRWRGLIIGARQPGKVQVVKPPERYRRHPRYGSCVPGMLHGDIQLRHSGFRPRKRRNAHCSHRSFTNTCPPREHRTYIPRASHDRGRREPDPVRSSSHLIDTRTARRDDVYRLRAADRMRTNVTSGLSLSLCVSVAALMVLVSVGDRAYAKRGCSAFGHSCFGGHGKRFDPHVRDDVLRNVQPIGSGRSQDYEASRFNNELFLLGPEEKLQGRRERSFPATRQDSQRFDPNALSLFVGQWLASHRRSHRPDLGVNNK
ncbi:hypothetical protein KM043_013790 [Ampulex compressa]|nr:hypothetical protein KM043_013790 [Ampulex compressa]